MSEFHHQVDTTDEATEMDLRQILNIIRKWLSLIIILTLSCTIVVGLISFYVLHPVYQAKVLLMVTVASDKLETQAQTTINRQISPNGQTNSATTTAAMPVLTMNTYLGQLKSEAVMNRVVDSINIPGVTSDSVAKMIDASIVANSNLIEVQVRNSDPLVAAEIANAVSTQYLKLINELMFSSVVVISPANIPSNPVLPNKSLNVAIAFLFGLMLSIPIAFFLEYLDNTLKTADDINRELNLLVLGLIPAKTAKNTRQNGPGGKDE